LPPLSLLCFCLLLSVLPEELLPLPRWLLPPPLLLHAGMRQCAGQRLSTSPFHLGPS
jgi:hypothetical protein